VPASPTPLTALVESFADELVAIRRDLHAHPELGRTEQRTTRVVADRLRAAGLEVRLLPGSGLVCDIGPGQSVTGRRRVALRADLDALPVADTCGQPWHSTVSGVAHACGHDVHTAAVLGAGLALAALADAGELTTGVRLIFQAAEEVQPGGSLDAMAAGVLDGVGQIFAVHCDPRVDVGKVGTRIGPITSASDEVTVVVSSGGGHTSRPHLTGDLVYALATLVTEMPAALSRRVDPRAGMSLVWGRITAGSAANAIPARGEAEGTLRCLDVNAWRLAADLIPTLAGQLIAPYGVEVSTEVTHGVPPVMNDPDAIGVLQRATELAVGPGAAAPTDQSLGGEDFAWYLEHVPGAMARLGVRPAGVDTAADLHTPGFDPDEDAIAIGMTVLASCALLD
jgi:amidohydrolase